MAPDTRPELRLSPEEVARQRRAQRLALQNHTSTGITRSYLKTREASLLREISTIQNELRAVRQQLAKPTAA